MRKRKTSSSGVKLLGVTEQGRGAGAELSGPPSLPPGRPCSPRLACPYGHVQPLLSQNLTRSVSSVAAGDPGGAGRGGAARWTGCRPS